MKGCPFCDVNLIEGQTITLENEHSLFLQMPQEVLIGSGLIVPKIHRDTMFDLTKEEWESSYNLLHEVKKVIDEQYNPEGYNVGWNCGEVGGQHIFHAHMHIIPRFADEPFAGRGIRSWLKNKENKREKR